MRELINWVDHVVEYPSRFTETDLGSGMIQLDKAPGTVKQQGTPQSATNFNTMDLAAFESMLIGNENSRKLLTVQEKVESLDGEAVQVTLTNTYEYPFNNSIKTVQIPTTRNTTDYVVEVELVSKTGNGGVGNVIISDKLLNGFKIRYTGSATSVVFNLHIKGGI